MKFILGNSEAYFAHVVHMETTAVEGDHDIVVEAGVSSRAFVELQGQIAIFNQMHQRTQEVLLLHIGERNCAYVAFEVGVVSVEGMLFVQLFCKIATSSSREFFGMSQGIPVPNAWLRKAAIEGRSVPAVVLEMSKVEDPISAITRGRVSAEDLAGWAFGPAVRQMEDEGMLKNTSHIPAEPNSVDPNATQP
jgi:non-canonical (house-cleaning) NTP pyrophosphatase